MRNELAAVGLEQIRLIERSRAFLESRSLAGGNVAMDPECYLNSWAPCPGFARLRTLAHGAGAQPARLYWRLRDAARAFRVKSAVVAGEGGLTSAHASAIVSWALPTDFDADGHYRDRYLNLGSRDTPGTLWVLLLVSGEAPPRFAGNVRLLHRPASPNSRAPRPDGERISGAIVEARDTAAAVLSCLRGSGVRRLVMPYEAQPFQHAIVRALRAAGSPIETVGYVHSALPALPTDYLFRDGAPDKLLAHGEGQAEILTRWLGWPAARVEVIESLRYLRAAQVPFAGRILLPYAFDDADFIVSSVAAMLAGAAPGSMPRWQVQNHPVQVSSAKHLKLVERLEAALREHADRGTDDARVNAQTLMIGATAAVIESLERGLAVVHVCTDPLFQKQSGEIWRHLDVETLASNVYRYRLREPGVYIRLGSAQGSASRLGLEAAP